MAVWQDFAIIILRTMLNDTAEATYSDNRIEELLITAAYYLPTEVNFVTEYTVDIVAGTISPDPISTSEDGKDFISMMTLKALCIIDQGAFRNAAVLQGLKAVCGPASLDTGAHGQYLKDLLNIGPCATFEKLKEKYNFDYNGKGILRAVMSPFVSNDFYPPMGDGGTHRDRNSY